MITRTATKRVNWAAYKISQASDRVGVYVSIVSTKIPYKGAGKEYIGALPLYMLYRFICTFQSTCLLGLIGPLQVNSSLQGLGVRSQAACPAPCCL